MNNDDQNYYKVVLKQLRQPAGYLPHSHFQKNI